MRAQTLLFRVVLAIAVCAVLPSAIAGASYKLKTTWKAPDAGPIDFATGKVAALVITPDMNLRISAEEALKREIQARGRSAVAAYTLVPREELTDKDKARAW